MASVVVSLLHSFRLLVRSRAALHLEILALRHQLAVVNRSSRRRLRLTPADRMLWVWLSQVWLGGRSALHILRPETVIGWHRRGFRVFWTWRSQPRTGRPGVPLDVRTLIRELSSANPLWGAPRIHGELLKLGISVSQSTVAKYMRRHARPPSQTWRTFLANHATHIISHAVWLYYRFGLSFRDVEDLLARRGVEVTYEAIRKWCRRFGAIYARQLRQRHGRMGTHWHVDEVFVTIHGRRQYLWRAVDEDGDVLDILVPGTTKPTRCRPVLPKNPEETGSPSPPDHH